MDRPPLQAVRRAWCGGGADSAPKRVRGGKKRFAPIRRGHTRDHDRGEFVSDSGATDVDVLEVSAPELDDLVRLEDGYGREGTSKA